MEGGDAQKNVEAPPRRRRYRRPDVRELLTEYGSWRVKNEAALSGFPPVTLLYRILREGSVIRAPSRGMRYLYIPRSLSVIHKAWEDAPINIREVLEARYMNPGPDEPKAIALGISLGEFRRRIGMGHIWIEAWTKGANHDT